MKLFSSKKRVAAIGALTAATLVGGGMAYGYWTTTGTGTGGGTVGTSSGITVVGTAADALTPGGAGSAVTFTASNPADATQKITQIQLSGVTASDIDCDTSDFSMADVDFLPTEGILAPGAVNTPLVPEGLLLMANTTANQDDCKSATLTLAFTTS